MGALNIGFKVCTHNTNVESSKLLLNVPKGTKNDLFEAITDPKTGEVTGVKVSWRARVSEYADKEGKTVKTWMKGEDMVKGYFGFFAANGRDSKEWTSKGYVTNPVVLALIAQIDAKDQRDIIFPVSLLTVYSGACPAPAKQNPTTPQLPASKQAAR